MPERIFVTGSSGFVGSAVIEQLLEKGYDVAALLHCGSLKAGGDRVREVRGDIFSAAALDEGMAGCQGVIHLVGIISENPAQGITFERIHHQGAIHVIEAAHRARIKRFIHMSALGARPEAPSEYHRTKYAAEKALHGSGLDWTIFQPSLIHGPDGEFLKMEAAWARGKSPPWLFMPYFGGGLLGWAKPTSVQPVFVEDVARAFVEALDKPAAVGQTYPLGGSQALTWRQMHHLAAEIFTGKRKAAIPIPTWCAKALTHLVPASLLPFSRDQVIMSQEDSVCDMSRFLADFGWTPGGFEQTLGAYAARV